ncbi:hypothetical protein HOG48_03250 [Candidatus Peregrinibacteria bacterium]|jgi:hypothetical protein|nr:hypothetical protein [Candidatus Peregrinibacteria bacterium]
MRAASLALASMMIPLIAGCGPKKAPESSGSVDPDPGAVVEGIEEAQSEQKVPREEINRHLLEEAEYFVFEVGGDQRDKIALLLRVVGDPTMFTANLHGMTSVVLGDDDNFCYFNVDASGTRREDLEASWALECHTWDGPMERRVLVMRVYCLNDDQPDERYCRDVGVEDELNRKRGFVNWGAVTSDHTGWPEEHTPALLLEGKELGSETIDLTDEEARAFGELVRAQILASLEAMGVQEK